MSTAETSTQPLHAHVPSPPSERRAWALAGSVGAVGLAVLLAVLTGLVGRTPRETGAQPPAIPARAGTPPAAAGTAALSPLGRSLAGGATIVPRPTTTQQARDAHRFRAATRVHIPRRWIEGFYPIYATAQGTFGVNWLLLASIHMQESAFSTAPGTYSGLNFARCCGGPMQFNVTNGSRPDTESTWKLVSNSYLYGRRPAVYDHMTAAHPSIYDDFDAIMAAGRLLSANGAGYALDGSAWAAAYDYYGHDQTGVLYADEVLARAIGWSQHGFCINCGVGSPLTTAVHAAYGAPVASSLEAEAAGAARASNARRHAKRP